MYMTMQTTLKCLASGKKLIEWLNPTEPQQTPQLELLLVCYIFLHEINIP